MYISGFSFVRNAVKFDYPVVESIKSILPICDEFVIAVGNSNDGTRQLIESINDNRIKIIDTIWDDSIREGGKVLAVETNKAYDAVNPKSDWAFYIQADEVVHEKYHDIIYDNLKSNLYEVNLDGFLFNYKHFYGSYDYVGESLRWYRNEIRIVKNNKNIYSHRDAQGFRKDNNKKLLVKKINAEIYHYGWVKHPKYQQAKQETFNKLWHDDNWVNKNVLKSEEFDYSNIDSLELFSDIHPKVMLDRIQNKNWQFEHNLSFRKYSPKERFKRFLEKLVGYRMGEYKNYILLK